MSEKLAISKAPITSEIDFADILCKFHFNNHECFAIKLPDNAEIPRNNDKLLNEICRFKVDDYNCVIMLEVAEQQSDETNLGIILTARELQIATLVASGCPNKQVADKLHISEWTVATYLRRIFAKLGVDTRAAMTYRCASLICKQNVILTK